MGEPQGEFVGEIGKNDKEEFLSKVSDRLAQPDLKCHGGLAPAMNIPPLHIHAHAARRTAVDMAFVLWRFRDHDFRREQQARN
jgi:hypothetical protein